MFENACLKTHVFLYPFVSETTSIPTPFIWESPPGKHLSNYNNFNEIVSLIAPNADLPSTVVNLKAHIFNAVHTNFEVIVF